MHGQQHIKNRKPVWPNHIYLHCRFIGAIFKKVRTENTLKINNTLVLPTFLYGSQNWTLTTLQRRTTETAEMKLLRPLAGYKLYAHKTNDYIRR